MRAREREVGGRLVLEIEGELDLASEQRLEAALDGAAARQEHDVVVNMARVDFVDSAAIAVLLRSRARLQEAGRDLHLVSDHPRTRWLLARLRVDRYLPVHERLGDAFQAAARPPGESPPGAGDRA